ncbi:hypothetical protein JAAARDRAFT_194316 [Jaapia argillacea MUCL 33604]|uniref:Uncharacterized protein n=1 Tax=Jaapia argillacea MUCL 33604 TaxID=933084 RepID=A0A067PQQ0_9AGAM|nr:hypothetical protein JAAARDRAFT_194316 [Jaapia argillacea MUCL 33604]
MKPTTTTPATNQPPVILRFTNSTPTKICMTPFAIRDTLNKEFSDDPNIVEHIQVITARWTRGGNIAVLPSPTCTAQALAVAMRTGIPKSIYHKQGDVNLDIGVPWHQVVVNRVPTQPDGIAGAPDNDKWVEEFQLWNPFVSAGGIKDFCPLVRGDADTDMVSHVSLMFSLESEAAAADLLRTGFYCFGTHCRTSIYKPRQCPQTRHPHCSQCYERLSVSVG